MLAERGALIRGIPQIFDELSEHDRSRLYAIGKSLSFAPDTPIFSPGDEHQGIHLIETGRRPQLLQGAFGPRGHARLLAPRQFCRRSCPCSVAARICGSRWQVPKSTTIFLPGRRAADAGGQLGGHRAGIAGCLGIQSALLFDHGADAGPALGERTSQASLAISRERLWPERAGRNGYRSGVYSGRARQPDRIDAAVGDGPAGAIPEARDHPLRSGWLSRHSRP